MLSISTEFSIDIISFIIGVAGVLALGVASQCAIKKMQQTN